MGRLLPCRVAKCPLDAGDAATKTIFAASIAIIVVADFEARRIYVMWKGVTPTNCTQILRTLSINLAAI